jgi:hypothetical protein
MRTIAAIVEARPAPTQMPVNFDQKLVQNAKKFLEFRKIP